MKKAKKLIKKLGLMPPNKLGPAELAGYFDEVMYSNEHVGIATVGGGTGCMGRTTIKGAKSDFKVAVVGKGVTFDSGGVSLKPGHNMHLMKFDMLGAATVCALKHALKAPQNATVELYGCCAENGVGGNRARPGDVIQYPNGTRVEIVDTDAEGRLVLADGILEAKKGNPDIIITVATLTGSAKAALGPATALFSNNDVYAEEMLAATKELLWRMPIWDIHRENIKHSIKKVADLKNIGTMAGASTAAAFLEHFVGDTPWIHLDIAGSAYKGEMPTCVMLETLTSFINEL